MTDEVNRVKDLLAKLMEVTMFFNFYASPPTETYNRLTSNLSSGREFSGEREIQ